MTSKRQVIEMIKLEIEGVSRTEIAKRFDITKGRVSQILNTPDNLRIKKEMTRQIQGVINRVAAKMKAKEKNDADSD